jgi:hypothetical protein
MSACNSFSGGVANAVDADGLRYQARTVGWEPTCKCGADTVPATILEPFLGSGTTALVALQLGRNAIGIELNPEYAELARQRCAPELAQPRLEV